MVAAIETRPSPLCYLHLLQGGGAVDDMRADATAFGCRDWDFACVVTAVWPRNQDGTEAAQSAVRWVYQVVGELLPLANGVYGADLGADPRDTVLATKAFGANRSRLARLKQLFDPANVLAYACPLPKAPMEPKLIILVTGESLAGKDYFAEAARHVFTRPGLKVRVASISDATKQEYAAATGADLARLLSDRAYKEEHRPALTKYFRGQVHRRPQLPEEHFLELVYGAADVDVLLITGMRDETPVVHFSHLVPDSKLIDVRIQYDKEIRQCRGRGNFEDSTTYNSTPADLAYQPSLTFNNDMAGDDAIKQFATRHLLPLAGDDLLRLERTVRLVPNVPCPGITFLDVLGILQHAGGRELCTSLLMTHYTGCWGNVDAIAACESGGWLFASALAERVGVRQLMSIRKRSGHLPPPTVRTAKRSSYISSEMPGTMDAAGIQQIEMSSNRLRKGSSVLVVDDVLASGETLGAVLELLGKAGVYPENVCIMVVAELPHHRGREKLWRLGYGKVIIQSLLVFGGA